MGWKGASQVKPHISRSLVASKVRRCLPILTALGYVTVDVYLFVSSALLIGNLGGACETKCTDVDEVLIS